MSRPIADYLLALAVCAGLAIGYHVTIVPMVRPEQVAEVEWRQDRAEFSDSPFNGLFPPGSWQLDEPRSLQADWGTLLFRERTQVAPDRWKVSPVTVILAGPDQSSVAGGSGAKMAGKTGSPIIMQATDGAIVEFEEPLNVMRAASPKIKGGQLIGQVSISNCPEAAPQGPRRGPLDPAHDIMDLRTSNVRIDSRQIRSAEAVELRLGGARLKGRDFTIQLAGGGTLPTDVGSPREVLDTLELIYLDELTVPLPEGPLWQPLDQPPTTDPARLEVQCQGSVLFDFATFALRLSDHVRILHAWSGGRDTFDCIRLDLQLADPEASATGAGPTASAMGSQLSEVRGVLRRISATGFPMVARVPSLRAEVVADQLDLDLERGLFRLAANQQAVRLRHRGIEMQVPAIEYRFDVEHPERLGALVASGGGKMSVTMPDVMLRNLRWQQDLRILPLADGHQLQLRGGVSAEMEAGRAGADELLLLFTAATFDQWGGAAAAPVPPLAQAGPGAGDTPVAGNLRPVSQRTRTVAGSAGSSVSGLQAQKFSATGNVHVDLPEFAADTDALFVEFDHVPEGQIAGGSDAVEEPATGPTLFPATGPRERRWIVGPEGEEKTTVAPVARPRPRLRGKRINANLVLQGTKILSQDVSIEQDVLLQHEMASGSGALPLTYRGDALRFIMGRSEQLVQIAGSPARIELGDGYFSGPLVILNGRQNTVLIRDRGTFQMPSSVMPGGTGQGVRWEQPPRCEFQGELTFDGQVVEIGDEVRLSGRMAPNENGEAWQVLATAPLMKVVLDRAIEVTQPTDARQAAVDLVSLIGGQQPVQLVAEKLDSQGMLLGRHVLVNPRLNVTPTSGRLAGDGPGWYRSWIPATGESALRTVTPAGSLMATHLIYNGGLEGDFATQQLSFFSGVRVGLGAVPRWETLLDAAAMTQLRLNQGTVDCDRLSLGRGAGAEQAGVASQPGGVTPGGVPWEMRAEGGVAFRFLTERGLFDGTAARAAYDSARDLFVLDGLPGRNAVVRQQNPQTAQQLWRLELQQLALTPDFNPATLDVRASIMGAQMRAPAGSQLPGGAAPRGQLPNNQSQLPNNQSPSGSAAGGPLERAGGWWPGSGAG